MRQVNIYQAKTQLSKLIAWAEAGEEVVISRAGKPVARLVPFDEKRVERVAGRLKGLIELSEDWDSADTNRAVAEMYEGSPLLPTPK